MSSNRFAWVIMAAVLAATSVAAEDTAKRESVDRLLGVVDVERQIREGLEPLRATLNLQAPRILHETLAAHHSDLSPADEREIAHELQTHREEMSRLYSLLLAEIDFAQLTALYAEAFAKHYTSDEIEALTAFYQTPLGRKMLEVTPDFSADLSAGTVRIVMPALERAKVQLAEDLIARLGKPIQPSPASPR